MFTYSSPTWGTENNIRSLNKFNRKMIIKMHCNQIQKHFPFDLGSAFANLARYLTTKDKLELSSTCTLLRQTILRGGIWQTFEINDTCIVGHWDSYLSWIEKYLSIIEPFELIFTIVQEEHEQDSKLLNILIQPRKFIRHLSIRTNSNMLHLALANSCSNTAKVTLMSNCISDEFVECMFKYLKSVSEFEISCDSLDFSCKNISNYLNHPLEKLILKPYRLDYQEIISLVQCEEINRINELEIDVEQCEEDQLVEIVSHLKHISRLRLYHLEQFERPEFPQLIASKLSSEMKELTLTKGYHLDMTAIIDKVASPFFQNLDLTEATKLNDNSVLVLASKCVNLKQLNLSWCNEVTNKSLSKLIRNCLALERVTLSGVKSLNDEIFEEYLQFKPLFLEKKYDQIMYDFRLECKRSQQVQIPLIDEKYKKQSQLGNLFHPHPDLLARRRTLTNLRHLECISCNLITDSMLKMIYCFNRMAHVINYYGNDLSLCRNNFEQEFIN